MLVNAGRRGFDAVVAAPFGAVGFELSGDSVYRIKLLPPGTDPIALHGVAAKAAAAQLSAYFDDRLASLDFPHLAKGTAFQQEVWRAISRVPVGRTLTYGELADTIGAVARAIGQACGDNPLPLLIPCHRIVSRAGLGGFGHASDGFLPRVKRWLLAHEAEAFSLR